MVTGGASAAYGSDAIAGVINFIMKNFEGFQVEGQFNENWHDNHDSYIQSLVTQFGVTPTTGTSKDGRQRSFDVLMGTNFADNKGNITAYLSYRHADPVTRAASGISALPIEPNDGCGPKCYRRDLRGFEQFKLVRAPDRPQREQYLQRTWDRVHPTGNWNSHDTSGVVQLAAVHLHDARRRPLQRGGARA